MDKYMALICNACKDNSSASDSQSKNYCPVYSLEFSLVCAECLTSFNMGYEVIEAESTSDTFGNPDQTLSTGPLVVGDESFQLEISKPQHSDDSRHKCKICPSTFRRKGGLTQHMRKHNDQNPFRCTLCDKDFESKSHLKIHMETHTNASPLECPICHSTFKGKICLKAHMKKHNEKNPFKCKLCDYSCVYKSFLEKHLSKHSNERPHKCSFCPKSYKDKSSLNKHMKIHDEQNLSKINGESLMAKQFE